MTNQQYIQENDMDVLISGHRSKRAIAAGIRLLRAELKHWPFTCNANHFGISVQSKQGAGALVFNPAFSPSFLEEMLNQQDI